MHMGADVPLREVFCSWKSRTVGGTGGLVWPLLISVHEVIFQTDSCRKLQNPDSTLYSKLSYNFN